MSWLPGGVRERPNRHAWKACEVQASVGSNPTPSAMNLAATNLDSEFMNIALDEARAALAHDDVPIGAVVVRDGVVIARRHNERELAGDPTAHAEVLTLRDAAAAVGHWRLNDCTLYVTLEPCLMCAGALVNARIGRIVYGAADPKAGAVDSLYRVCADERLNHRPSTESGVLAEECSRLLKAFFAARRD